jgi:uncharacterized protein (DUF433 family)
VLAGKPVIKGTRLSVALILDLLGQGWSQQTVLANYPQLKPEHVQAALAFAAEHLREDDYIAKGKAAR